MPIETCYSGLKDAVLRAKSRDEGWDPLRLVIPMIGTLFCKHKIEGDVLDVNRHAILVLKSRF